MSLLVAWVVFPLVLAVLCLGCGLLVELISGVRLPAALLAPTGLATVIVVASLAAESSATAKLATPAVVMLTVVGLGLTTPWRAVRLDRWALATAFAVFAVYAAPIVLSGQATFAGYITLDDTATWLAITDRVMEHGHDLSGLQPSTYEAALDMVRESYPVGSFLPLGVGSKLVGMDIAWLFQPYIAFVAAMVGLSLYSLPARLIVSSRLRAFVAFIAAQAALIYGYGMWGGIKEMTSVALITLFAALLPDAISAKGPSKWHAVRAVLPLAVTVAAELVALSVGGIAWLLPAFVLAATAAVRLNFRLFAIKALALMVFVAILSVPALLVAERFVRTGAGLTSQAEIGNLFHPLSWLQFFGIWPAADFRGRPKDLDATRILIILLVLAAAVGVWWAWRRRAWSVLLYLATVEIGALLLITQGSPWVDAKVTATASPAVLLVGLAACGRAFESGRRVEATVVAAAIAGGVLWSTVLAYHGVWLAPRPQLAELESIGERFAGDGPTLMTEYQPYGARHFLRRMDPEAATELRRRTVPLLNGEALDPHRYGDLDRFRLDGILVYKTLVLRRSPTESRPPGAYQLVWSGSYYDVWQQDGSFPAIHEHLPLGDAYDPAEIPACDDILALARRAGSSGRLAAPVRTTTVLLDLTEARYPAAWQNLSGLLRPHAGGTLDANVTLTRSARYRLWVGGSFRDRLRLFVDRNPLASLRHRLQNEGQYNDLGEVDLQAGAHDLALRYDESVLPPGAGGFQFGIGPLILTRDTSDTPLTYVSTANARALCGKNLDWVEATG
ncbi:MAG: hypothetical protein M3P18_07185 [Actinomycetota bacterium]|nr:hypothetical protein [Actinomycetota bacterium]